MTRELDRARAGLAEEELRNRALPPLEPATTVQEHQRRFDEVVKAWVDFLRKNDFITWHPWMEPALAVLPGGFDPTPPLEFFAEVEARDRCPCGCTCGTSSTWRRWRTSRRPVQSVGGLRCTTSSTPGPRGWATAMEELMMHAGLFDGRPPRARGLVDVIARAARGAGDG